MFKTALDKFRTHLVITVAAVVCTIVAVVALGFTVYEALRLVVIPVAASAQGRRRRPADRHTAAGAAAQARCGAMARRAEWHGRG